VGAILQVVRCVNYYPYGGAGAVSLHAEITSGEGFLLWKIRGGSDVKSGRKKGETTPAVEVHDPFSSKKRNNWERKGGKFTNRCTLVSQNSLSGSGRGELHREQLSCERAARG